MRSFHEPGDRAAIVARIRRLTPASPRQWGTMDAPRMVAHLTDQMRHTQGDATAEPMRSLLRLPGIHYLGIYWIPWPKGRVKGPPAAFVTKPANWDADVERLIGLVERMAAQDPAGPWPPHVMFGRMTGRDWGAFCFKHFDHHLRQFGV